MMICAECRATPAPLQFLSFHVDYHACLQRLSDGRFLDSERFCIYDEEGSPPFLVYHALVGERVFSITPDVKAPCGPDLHLYEIAEQERELTVCSRKCAVLYARKNNDILLHRATGISITPDQDAIDQSALSSGNDRKIALTEMDEARTPVAELRWLLRVRPQFPDRIISLAQSIEVKDEDPKLVERAVEFLYSEYELEDVVQPCVALLNRLGKPEESVELIDDLIASKGGEDGMSAFDLAMAAVLLNECDYGRALSLSKKAFEKDPNEEGVIDTLLPMLLRSDPKAALELFREHGHVISHPSSFFNAGLAFLRVGLFEEAADHFRTADLLDPTPDYKAYLAGCLCRLGRYAEALEFCVQGMDELRDAQEMLATDFDGEVRNRIPFTLRHEDALKQNLLVTHGECLIKTGDIERGKERIKRAINLDTREDRDEFFFDGVEQLIGDYHTRAELAQQVDETQQKLREVLEQFEKSKVQIGNLGKLIDALAETRKQWAALIAEAKNEALSDVFAESASIRIRNLCDQIALTEGELFDREHKSVEVEYREFPPQARKALAVSRVLLQLHTDDQIPIYAGVVVEIMKALELTVKDLVISPFIERLRKTPGNETDAALGRAVGETQRVRGEITLIERGKMATLTMGNVANILRHNDARWTDDCKKHLQAHEAFVTTELREAFSRYLTLRNSAAHQATHERIKATEVQETLAPIFKELNNLGLFVHSRRSSSGGASSDSGGQASSSSSPSVNKPAVPSINPVKLSTAHLTQARGFASDATQSNRGAQAVRSSNPSLTRPGVPSRTNIKLPDAARTAARNYALAAGLIKERSLP